MHRKTLVALLGAIVIAGAASGVAFAAGSGPAVSVTIKTATKTLLQTTTHGEKGWITKGGTPKGQCSGNTAAGALDAATHGKWTAKYYSGVTGGVFVTSILGVKPKGQSAFWELIVNGKSASKGVCEIKLHTGEKIGFKLVG
jgi:Domain of unknown function (DUF4430)